MLAIGAAFASALKNLAGPLVVTLEGELGAGKTTFVAALLHAFGFVGHVRSPTYTLIEPYELAGRALYHLDLYRLTDPREVDALALRDLLESRSIFLIEWPERGAGALPAPDIAISIRYAGADARALAFNAVSKSGRDALLAFTAAAKP
jgi:tRNA threonylcarbamoyladenosine biosynthesis protein TsaE